MTMPHICINLINLSAELSLIMLTLLKRYKEHRKMPSQHRVSGKGGDGGGQRAQKRGSVASSRDAG